VIKEKKSEYFDDYLPDPNIINILFECLLDRHSDFVPIKDPPKKARAKLKSPRLMLLL